MSTKAVPVQQIVLELFESGWNVDSLSRYLEVPAVSVRRWTSGSHQPRAIVEGKLRELHSIRHERAKTPLEESPSGMHELARQMVDRTLADLREAFHRRGRMSSRNEALDEVSKLLFAHVMSVAEGKDGILAQHLLDSPAAGLKSLIHEYSLRLLPVGAEKSLDAYELRLAADEDHLAREIIEGFRRLGSGPVTKVLSGPEGLDFLNEVFGKFVANSLVEDKELGQYLTPPQVVDLIVDLAFASLDEEERTEVLHPNSGTGGLVLDPSCGTGSFLTAFLRRGHHLVLEREGESAAKLWLNDKARAIAGFDKSERMLRLATTNVAMLGVAPNRLHLLNSLASFGPDREISSQYLGTADFILTNPPFGAEFRGADLAGYELAQLASGKGLPSEILFLERYLEWLKPGGRLLAILPDSVLTNKGYFHRTRQFLRNRIELKTVVSLPAVTFGAAGTSTKTSIVHFRKTVQPNPRTSKTFFSICNEIGYRVSARGSFPKKIATEGSSDLSDILSAYSSHETDVVRVRSVAGVEAASRWDATYHASLPAAIQVRLEQPSLLDVRIKEVADLSRRKVDPKRFGTELFKYIEISDVSPGNLWASAKNVATAAAPSRARRLLSAGDVLVSTVRPERRAVAVVLPEQDGFVCSTGFAVLTPKGIHPLLLAMLLKSDFVTEQIMRNNVGIAYPAIDEECLLDVLLPATRNSLQVLENIATTCSDLEVQLRGARQSLAESVTELMSSWMSSLR